MRNRAQRTLSTKTAEWRAVGLGPEVERHSSGFYLGELLLLSGLIVATLVLFGHRQELLPGSDLAARVVTMLVMIILGWLFARALGRGLAPMMLRRLDPASAGTLGFLLRLVVFAGVVVIALRIAGLQASTLVAGGAFTAVIVGLAAQQTLGNLVAGLVLQTTRPFRAGDRVRLINGMFSGPIEAVVSQPGLIHTTMYSGADRIVVPNREILAAAIMPLTEPEGIDMELRFPAELGPRQLQELLDEEIETELLYPTDIELIGLDRSEVLFRVKATPLHSEDGGRLAEEIIEIVREHGTGASYSAPRSGFDRAGERDGDDEARRRAVFSQHAGDGLL